MENFGVGDYKILLAKSTFACTDKFARVSVAVPSPQLSGAHKYPIKPVFAYVWKMLI